MLVSDFIAHSAGNAPDRTALVFDNRRFTYGALNSVSFHLASYLAAAGLRRGDRVGVYLGNSPEAVISIFGAVAAGGCFVVINPTIKEDKLRHILADSGARFLITVPNTQARAARACATRDAVVREHFPEFAG